ncbi:MAG TPA: enoyl-CoA hydratase/isomerase family protein [Ramlibacter sp.]|nr:enoyl-CoA hydratase/isomerase family protein [Ramlibacter sp.]
MALKILREGAVHTLVLDRSEAANALSGELVDRLTDGVREAGIGGAQVLVLRGEGRNFSAGFDFGGIEGASDADLLQRFVHIELLLQAVADSPCLTVALAHGPTFGAGADLFAACRWRIADPGTRFRMPGLAFGIVLGTRRLAALVGAERARELLEALSTFDAAQAQAIGFATRVVARDDWSAVVQEALEVAGRLPAASRAALHQVLAADHHDHSMADLVRSAAVPGLKDRMLAYRQAQLAARRPGLTPA